MKKNWLYLLLLILSGEAIFILPFVLARVFRPTVLHVFELTNLELGTCYSFYGLVALVAYPLGGPLADRFPPRKLIAVALILTALGGVYYASYPSLTMLKVLYGYWGFTTIFLFWASMIKATRIWGGEASQGKAFGFLDGGRGLVGALFGTLGVFIFSLFMVGQIAEATLENSQQAFKQVVLISSAIVVVIAIFVWFFMKSKDTDEAQVMLEKITLSQVKDVLKIPAIWLLMIIILCGYVGYKLTDIFSQYAQNVMGFDQIESAQVGTFLLYIRPVIGIIIGFIADSSRISLWLVISFSLTIVGAVLFASGIISESLTGLFFMSILISATGIYSIRALYFASMKEGKIPVVLTGTAVGLISLVGYTPDIFVGPSLVLLDNYPGELGFQYVFLMLGCFALVGLVASLIFYNQNRKSKTLN